MVDLQLAPRRVTVALVLGFVFLLVCYLITLGIRLGGAPGTEPFINALFDFDREGNLPSWYNAILFVIAAACSWINGRYARTHDARQAAYWYMLALVMLGLSIDELVALHELLSRVRSLQEKLYFGWMVILGPLAALLAIAFVPFLLRLPRGIAVMLIASGAVFVTGAIVLEMVAGKIVESLVQVPRSDLTVGHWALIARNPYYLLEVVLEESLEQCGLMIYIHAALSYLSNARAVMVTGFAAAR